MKKILIAATALTLLASPLTNPYSADIIVPNVAEAARLASLLDRGLASMAAVSSSPPLPSKRKVKRREKEEEDDEKKKTRAGKVGRKVAGSVSSAATRKRRASSSPSSSPPPPPSASEVTFSLPQQEQGARAVVSPGSA